MKKRIYKVLVNLFAIICCIVLISGCNNQGQAGSGTSSVDEPAISVDTEPSGLSSATQSNDDAQESALPDVFPLEFVFASGAGAWGTSLTLNRDGSFDGGYTSSERTETGVGYSDGTVYTSEFTGTFSDIIQIDDTSYSLTLNDLTLEGTLGDSVIKEYIRYLNTEPLGMADGKEFIFYMPDTPFEGLSDKFLGWWPGNYRRAAEASTTMGRYGLYNVETESGFFTGRTSSN